MKETRHIDAVYKPSTSQHALVSNVLDSMGATTQTVKGRALLHYIVTTATPGNEAIRSKINDITGKIKHDVYDNYGHDKLKKGYSAEVMGSTLAYGDHGSHPLISQIALERLIDHGSTIQDHKDLHDHLHDLGHTIRQYKFVAINHNIQFPRMLVNDVPTTGYPDHFAKSIDNDNVIFDVVPKKYQEKIASDFIRLLDHPNLPEKGSISKDSISRRLKLETGQYSGFPSTKSAKQEPSPNQTRLGELFTSSGINHPDVRMKILDHLDRYETKSPASQELASSVRGAMLRNASISGRESIRHIQKYVSNPNSINGGFSTGIYSARSPGYHRDPNHFKYTGIHDIHELPEVDAAIKKQIGDDAFSKLWADYTTPGGHELLGDDVKSINYPTRHAIIFQRVQPKHTWTHDETLDFLGHLTNLYKSHPNLQGNHKFPTLDVLTGKREPQTSIHYYHSYNQNIHNLPSEVDIRTAFEKNSIALLNNMRRARNLSHVKTWGLGDEQDAGDPKHIPSIIQQHANILSVSKRIV